MSEQAKAAGETTPSAVTAETIAAALERFKEQNATPLEHHDATLGAVFRYRRLTGGEVQDALKLAQGRDGALDNAKLTFLVINRASVEPKVTTALWDQLLQLPPLVAAGLSEAIKRVNGLGDDPLADAGNALTASPD